MTGGIGSFIEPMKRSIVIALREAIDDDLPSDDVLRRVKDNIDLEYPTDELQYPGMWVQFSFTRIIPSGITPTMYDEDGNRYAMWTFEGRITVNVVALTSLERDRISDAVISMFAFREYFAM